MFLRCLFLVSTVLLFSCTHKELRQPSSLTEPPAFTQLQFPNASALVRWTDNIGPSNDVVDPLKVERRPLNCIDTNLYPTHPQQMSKVYHVALVGRYDMEKLTAEDEACAIGSKYKNTRGIKMCLRADSVEYNVLSDTYADSCGNMYRGFWEVSFLQREDNMGTLFSKGRVLYEKPRAEFPKDMYVAQTYAVPVKEFLFLSPLFKDDLKNIEEQRREAEKTHRYNPTTHLYELIQAP